ncbi:MAG TPA: glycosyltransferase family 4 protein [Candidatus Sulfopaludibacter sp.]|jgi:glycosyltransferase involved in cell wall biosynthesis|nr:glycosyltransferase family 4 protein [Candidatus Sulfopaludibacter sp.]
MIAPEAPFPLAGGGALRTASILHHLSKNYAVDLIVFRQPGAPDPLRAVPAGLVRRIVVIDLPANRRSLAAKALRNAVRVARSVPPLVDRFAGFEKEIAAAVNGRRYEVGIIEHSWCAPYVSQICEVCDRTVLNLHNIESVLHERCAQTESAPAALAHRVFREASLNLERRWLPRFSAVLATSSQDCDLVRTIAPSCHVVVYPNAIPLVPPPRRTDENAIVFSGNMEYHPNRTAVRYFRHEIWPVLRDQWPGLVWRLVGKNAPAVRPFTAGDPRIEVSGEVDDAIAELAKAQVAVVPLLAGSGTRLKILEAWAAAIPVVSTTLGAEGLPARDGEHLLLADGASNFAAAVSRLLACKELRETLGMGGRILMEKEFTWEIAGKNLDF